MEAGAALAHQDVAGAHALATELLDAEPLGVRLAVVPRGGLTLLVCHGALFLTNLEKADASRPRKGRRVSRPKWPRRESASTRPDGPGGGDSRAGAGT